MFRVFHAPPPLPELASKGFVADMHYHTSHSHDCTTPVRDVLKLARKLGVHVAITDHNRIGGVLEALQHKEAPVIPGIEVCTREGKEVIAYFYDAGQLEEFYSKKLARYIKEKNAMRSTRTSVRMAELLAFLEEEQCVVHVPHPFAPLPRRSGPYLMRREHLLKSIHSVEVFNGEMTRKANLLATGWAVQLGKGLAGGSDGHCLKMLAKGVTLSKATSIEEHLSNIRKASVEVYGQELRPFEMVVNYARTSGKSKIENGLKGGLRKLSMTVAEHL